MTASTHDYLTVYFDGQCPVCSREVALYRRLVRPGRIRWLDLARPTDALAGEVFSLASALELLHVKDAQGRLHVGLAAHLLMWDRLPVLRVLSWMLRLSPAARRWFEIAYLAFTQRRPGLVQRRVRGAAGRG